MARRRGLSAPRGNDNLVTDKNAGLFLARSKADLAKVAWRRRQRAGQRRCVALVGGGIGAATMTPSASRPIAIHECPSNRHCMTESVAPDFANARLGVAVFRIIWIGCVNSVHWYPADL